MRKQNRYVGVRIYIIRDAKTLEQVGGTYGSQDAAIRAMSRLNMQHGAGRYLVTLQRVAYA